ncbi:MAG: agmatinase family protein [Hyphomonadaceae bacterium]
MKTITLLGAACDANSSFLRGAALAPPLIRAALTSPSSNAASESGVELGVDYDFDDWGDVACGGGEHEFDTLRTAAAQSAAPLLTLGGDHSVTYPIVAGLAQTHGPLNILHFDAHPDLYESFEGNPYSHASPFARIMEKGHAKSLVQCGIRTLNAAQRAPAERYNVRQFPSTGFDPNEIPIPAAPLYITIDLDALDPAYCPGVSHYEPGGLSVRDVLAVLHRVSGPVVGADVVEFNPLRDVNERTAYVAAKFVKELASLMVNA